MKRREEVVERLDVLTRTIAHIDAALHGIADGSYGTCANCGSPIAEKRLRSIPWRFIACSVRSSWSDWLRQAHADCVTDEAERKVRAALVADYPGTRQLLFAAP